MTTKKTPSTQPAPATTKPAATTWQPTPGSQCHRAIVYMLTSGATHYRPAEIAAALGIRNGLAHEALRPAIHAGAVFSVPDPAHGTFRLYTIAPGWALQAAATGAAAEEPDTWPRQRWINADGTVRMDRTGTASSTPASSKPAAATAAQPAAATAAEAATPAPDARTSCDTHGTCHGHQPPCPGCSRATPPSAVTGQPTITSATTTHRLALHVDTDANAVHLTRGAEYIALTRREAATIGHALVAFGM